MPELTDDMYCSEQICIPPAFPYLLRQYAKAAIRTQPTDLLKWSTAYFRCLSLNIPPPVKPRLEYPIPRDFHGITPGWLKALLYQLQNNQTVPFKVLWDRWIGACLQHNTLIQILCLGGFDNALTIPWLRFVSICAALLTDDLTHTMILICEILTEEPEGGNAMISYETFIDLYKFLAKLDGSKDQTLRNYYFRDSLLFLWRERVETEEVVEAVHEEIAVESEQSVATKTSTESLEIETQKDDVEKVMSCPSLPEDDHYSLDYLLAVQPEEEEEEGDEEGEYLGEQMEVEEEVKNEETGSKVSETISEKEDAKSDQEAKTDDIQSTRTDETGKLEEPEDTEQEKEERVTEVEEEKKGNEPEEGEPKEVAGEGADLDVKEYESADTITDEHVRNLDNAFEDDETLREDLERLKALQQELAGETDEELEKFKCRLIEEMPLSKSQEDGIKHFKIHDLDHPESEEKLRVISGHKQFRDGEESSIQSQDEKDGKKNYEDVNIEAVPGIGQIVPDDLVQAVVDYMKKMAKIQHGMVMPRNIRHYSCPPLEILDY